jgi:hypothetical protein
MHRPIKISPTLQLEIFETVFLHLIEYPSMRYKIQKILDSRERVDQAELNLRLKRLELEIVHREGG